MGQPLIAEDPPVARYPVRMRHAHLLLALVALTAVTACDPALPDASDEPEPPSGGEREVSFDSEAGPVPGTLRVPDTAEAGAPVPGVVIVSGSGPTDRDGNSPLRPEADTNREFADLLARHGVASLRYDKAGSGEARALAGDGEEPVDFALFEEQLTAAYHELAGQEEVDSEHLGVLGHSEGALFALRAADLVGDHRPDLLILAAPPGDRYLDILDRQLTESVRDAEAAGQVETGEAARVLSDTRYATAALRDRGEVPEDLHPMLDGLYTRANADFLSHADALDPRELAEDLPSGLPSLVLWGTEDAQITEAEVGRLMEGLEEGSRVDVPQADHVFRLYDDSPGAARTASSWRGEGR
jgi:uncharacterized protein